MNWVIKRLPVISFALFGAFVLSMALRSHSETTTAIVASSLLMFAACWASATHLLGARAAARFVVIALCLGWFAEQMGASRGWFFGEYHYTDVLGWRLGDVPVIIPMMWFSICYTGYVIANLIVWRNAVDDSPRLSDALALSFLAAMIVTAFDLGGDPYLVFTLKAWIMVKTDGGWFGETIQGFVGWVVVAFAIIVVFRWSVRRFPVQRVQGFSKRHALVPLGMYGALMAFQVALGSPIETRVIAAFAMGIPLLCAVAGWRHWGTLEATR